MPGVFAADPRPSPGIELVLDRVVRARCPIELHFGATDPLSPPQAIAEIRAAFRAACVDREDVAIVVHPGATHGYSHRAHPAIHDRVAEAAGLATVERMLRVWR